MTLKTSNNNEMLPIACIPDSWGNKGGILICQESNGGSFRTGYAVKDLLKFNPPELVMGYVKNLEDDFFNWLTEQEHKYNHDAHGDYRWKKGDIPPAWFPPDGEKDFGDLLTPDNYVKQPEDTRTEEDYLEIKADPVRAPRRTARRNR